MSTSTTTRTSTMRKNQINYSPLVDALNDRGGLHRALAEAGYHKRSATAERVGRTYRNAARQGSASVHHVDEVCCDVLGLHPLDVYGHEWLAPEEGTPTPRLDATHEPEAAPGRRRRGGSWVNQMGANAEWEPAAPDSDAAILEAAERVLREIEYEEAV